MHIIDLPDDCFLIFLPWLSILDVVCLRMTCHRFSSVTRIRVIWHAIYNRLSKRLPMPRFPHPYTLENAPSRLLETYSVFAYRLNRHWAAGDGAIQAVRRFHLQSQIEEPQEPTDMLDQLFFLSGGRWLAEIKASWKVSLWDIDKKLKHVMRDEITNLGPQDSQAALFSSGCAVWSIKDRQITVLMHGTLIEENPELGYDSRVYAWCVDVPAQSDMEKTERYGDPLICAESAVNISRNMTPGVKALPNISIPSRRCSKLDVCEDMVSFHVINENEIHIYDWTYAFASTHGGRIKGLILQSSIFDDHETGWWGERWTRLLKTPARNYLLVITSNCLAAIYLVPPLEVAGSLKLPRIQIPPIAQATIPPSPYTVATSWDSFTNQDKGPYNISLCSQRTRCTLSFMPFSGAQSPSKLTCFTESLPIFRGWTTQSAIGESGSRGVYNSTQGGVELGLYSGALRSAEESEYFEDVSDTLLISRSIVPSSQPNGKIFSKLTLEETTGRVFYRYTMLTGEQNKTYMYGYDVLDFAPVKLEDA